MFCKLPTGYKWITSKSYKNCILSSCDKDNYTYSSQFVHEIYIIINVLYGRKWKPLVKSISFKNDMKNSEVSKIWMILPQSIVIVLNCTTTYKAVFKGPLPKIYWIFLVILTYGVRNVPKCAFFEIFKPFKWGQQQCACCNCIYTKSLLIFP